MTMIKELNTSECVALLGNNYVGRLGYVYGKVPFIVPVTYFHDTIEKDIISYSAEGHKLDAMRRYDQVAFHVDEIQSINTWRSVLVQGQFHEISGSDAKFYLHRVAEGVKKCFEKRQEKVPSFIQEFSSRLDDRGMPVVYKLSIKSITGRYREQ